MPLPSAMVDGKEADSVVHAYDLFLLRAYIASLVCVHAFYDW